MDEREWKRKTALNKRARDAEAAKAAGKPISDMDLDRAAAAYVGATVADVQRWRRGLA